MMAESLRAKNIRDVIRCIWCSATGGKDPHLFRLGCFHLGCKDCLQKKMDGSVRVHCSECGEGCTIPKLGVNQLKIDKLQFLGLTLYPSCSTSEDEDRPAHSTISSYCTDCKKSLCQNHIEEHQVKTEHVARKQESLSKETPKYEASNTPLCATHSTKEHPQIQEVFCKTCHLLVNSSCIASEHSNHDYVVLAEAGNTFRQELGIKISEIMQERVNLLAYTNELAQTLEDIEENCTSWIEDCKKWGEDIKNVVDRLIKDNVEKMVTVADVQRNEVKEIIENKTCEIKKLENAECYLNAVKKYVPDMDLLQHFESYMNDVTHCLQNEQLKISVNKIHVQHRDLKDAEDILKELFGELQFETLKDCQISHKWHAKCRLGVAIFGRDIVVTGVQRVELYRMNGQSKGELHSKELDWPFNVDVYKGDIYVTDRGLKTRDVAVLNRNWKLKRRISLPPVEKNTETLLVLSFGIDKQNGDVYVCSQKENTVYKCPSGQDIAKPFITQHLSGPLYLCVTSSHEILVSNYLSSTLCKFSTTGTLIWEYGGEGSNDGQLNNPRGVCTDHLDFIFIADYGNHKIHYLSPDGQFIQYIDIGQDMKHPFALAFKNKNLIVTYMDKNKVQVVSCRY